MNISEFELTYVKNAHRLALFEAFLKFVEKADEYLHPYQLAVYGSFITNKPSPGDIDVILQGFVRKDKWDEYSPSILRLDGPIHVKPFITMSMDDVYHLKPIDNVIKNFSNTEENKLRYFDIASYVQITF
ncbi:hypothetical protein EVC62_06685 [Salinicola endophyticus]|uniref:Polymerase nucleotidyl transferase domain-containing protein n=1 Tax=Salinicola endophyticus TaxID=1949083 RepID=A0ABY8FEY3_9GAMM|nr:hypothetical protein [Salinicola endophyticus]WFF41212.1 hypothetical protein EVC62_06685 [Salinicola endophyticus]